MLININIVVKKNPKCREVVVATVIICLGVAFVPLIHVTVVSTIIPKNHFSVFSIARDIELLTSEKYVTPEKSHSVQFSCVRLE